MTRHMNAPTSFQSAIDSVCQLLDKAGDFATRLDDHPSGAIALVALMAILAIVAVTVVLSYAARSRQHQ